MGRDRRPQQRQRNFLGRKFFRRRFFRRQNVSIVAGSLLCVVAYKWAAAHGGVSILTPQGLKSAITDTGMTGALVYIVVIGLAVVISPIPGTPLTIAAGAVWGPVFAAIYSIIGGFLGSLGAYFIGKTLGRSAVRALTGKVVHISKERGEWYVGVIIFLTRLLPLTSFDLVSYAAGMTGLSLSIYVPATLLGMIPATFVLTYMGASLTVSPTLSILLACIFTGVLILFPWAIYRYNWLGLRDVIRIE